MHPNNLLGALLGAFSCALLCASASYADTISYGDFDDVDSGGAVLYLDVSESSETDEVPQFGEPEVVVNKLDFDPEDFGSSSTDGSVDITDGQLNFMIEALPGAGITGLTFSEGGDYTLFGSGTDATSVAYGIYARMTVLEVDGEAVTPFSIETEDSGVADLIASAGLNQPWDLSVFLDVGLALTEEGIDYDEGVTLAEVVINDTLLSVSEDGTIAFIAKKDFMVDPFGDLTPDDVIPEPTALSLLALGLTCAVARRR